MPVVTISRELGSGGTAIAEGVGSALDAPCVDKEVLAEMARQAGIPVEEIVEAEERLLSRPLTISPEMRAFFAADPSQRGAMDQATFIRRMAAAIRSLAQRGNMVFVGRGAQLILQDRPDVLRVHIYAPLEVRAHRIQRRRSLPDPDAAVHVVQTADDARQGWYRRFFRGADWKHLRYYHLMLDTSRIPQDVAVSMIVAAAKAAPPAE